jgi:hypothetical protein
MSLINAWDLNGNSNDSVGSYNGTDTSVTYGAGKNNQAGIFSTGSGILITQNDLLSIAAGTPWTISLWIKPDSSQTSGVGQVLNFKEGITFSYNHGSSTFRGAFAMTPDGATYYSAGGQTFTALIWTFITARYDGSALTQHTNGRLVGTNNCGSIARKNETQYPYNRIGTDKQGTAFFPGRIDGVRLYNTALSQQEIKTLYMQQSGMF